MIDKIRFKCNCDSIASGVCYCDDGDIILTHAEREAIRIIAEERMVPTGEGYKIWKDKKDGDSAVLLELIRKFVIQFENGNLDGDNTVKADLLGQAYKLIEDHSND